MTDIDWSKAPDGGTRRGGRRAFKNPKLIFGHGVNDADYVTQDSSTGRVCPFFMSWRNMLRRVYSPAEHARRPSYIGTSVCEEWLVFSKFKAWMQSQNWKGKQLDKDLLCVGNRVYSPSTCCFVSREINSFLTDSAASRGDLPIGVCMHKNTGKYAAQIQSHGTGKRHIGLFDDAESAHDAWLREKQRIAKSLADNEDDPVISGALLSYFYSGYRKQADK